MNEDTDNQPGGGAVVFAGMFSFSSIEPFGCGRTVVVYVRLLPTKPSGRFPLNPPTSFIKRKAGASLLHSARTAAAISRPFNTFVTISLWRLGGDSDNASKFIRQLIERHFHRWSIYVPRGELRSRNGPPTYAWVVEAPGGLAHVHWMLHVQPGREVAFAMSLQKWVARRTGAAIIPEDVVQTKPVIDAEGLKLYFAKGLDPHLARLWRIHPTDCGSVRGPRARVSRNLGPSEWQPRKAAYLRTRRRAA